MRKMLLLIAFVTAGCSHSPNGLKPATFASQHGWHVGAAPAQDCPGTHSCGQVESWAATRPWRDCSMCAGADQTLAHLDTDGVVIYLSLAKEHFRSRSPLVWPPRLRAQDVVSPLEGHAKRFGLISRGGHLHGYSAGLYVWFGRPHPTLQQLARAQAELETAKLP